MAQPSRAGDVQSQQVGFSLLWAFVCHSDANIQAIAMIVQHRRSRLMGIYWDMLGYPILR
jgi:hypothetical protein